MTYAELKQAIHDNADSKCWLHNDEVGVWTLIADVSLTIREKRGDGDEDEFHEEWATSLTDPNAKKIAYDLYCGASFVERHYLVAVDGYRAYLPLPNPTTREISTEKYDFARCVDATHSLDDYIKRCGLSVSA